MTPPFSKKKVMDDSSLKQDYETFIGNLIYTWNNITATANPPILTAKSLWREITDMEPDIEQTLSPISGISKAGELFAVIGGSGVGKSTLLNILSYRHSSRIIAGGDRCLNGVPVGQRVLQDISVFVPQNEVFLPEVTVKEHLIFNVMLRTKFPTSSKEKLASVNEVLCDYGLWEYRDEYIGSSSLPKYKLKLLSLATEILENPAIVFCESPLYNYDSRDAFNILMAMKRIALKGKIVISTFKGPSSEQFMQFDTVCIMAKGLVAFQGRVQEALNFWEDQGYCCPASYNPCDFFLLTLRIHPDHPEEDNERNEKMVAQFQKTPIFKQMERLAHYRRWKTVAMSRLEYSLFRERSRYRASFCCQFCRLLKREASVTFRAFFPFYGRLLLTIAAALVYGVMFWDVEVSDNGTRCVVAFFFCSMTQNLIFATHCAILNFGRSLPMLVSENSKRVYRTITFYLVKNLCEIPGSTICPIVFVMISYPMIGVGSFFSQETIYGCITFTLATHICNSFGMLFTAFSGSILGGLMMTNFDILHLVFYSGLLLNTQATLPVAGFLHNISISYQMMDALMLIEFMKSDRFNNIEPSFGTTIHFTNGSNVMDYYNFNKDAYYWRGVAMVFCIAVIGFRIVTFIPLVFRLYLNRKFYPEIQSTPLT